MRFELKKTFYFRSNPIHAKIEQQKETKFSVVPEFNILRPPHLFGT